MQEEDIIAGNDDAECEDIIEGRDDAEWRAL